MNWAPDWDLAIKRNSEALNRIVAELFVLLGLGGTDTVGRIPQALHRAVLRVLWPAESAVRRLIIIVARGLVVKLSPSRPMPKGSIIGKGGQSGPSRSSFQLFDTRKNFTRRRHGKAKRIVPRIHFFTDGRWVTTTWSARPPAADPPPPDGLVGGEPVSRRLLALKAALDDLPRQARRMARWRLRREKAIAPKFRSPLRPGPPPGHRRKKLHEVDEVLANCHWLAWEAMKPDTS